MVAKCYEWLVYIYMAVAISDFENPIFERSLFFVYICSHTQKRKFSQCLFFKLSKPHCLHMVVAIFCFEVTTQFSVGIFPTPRCTHTPKWMSIIYISKLEGGKKADYRTQCHLNELSLYKK